MNVPPDQASGRRPRLTRWIAPILLFLLAFLPRVVYPVSRSMLWYYRAIYFSDAVLARDWLGTYQSCHPGVTTMWLSGIGIRLFAWQRGLSSAQLLGDYPAPPGTINDGVTAGIVLLALVVALCIVLSYFLLNCITKQSIALVGSYMLALDPFYLTSSKALHVDALLATFMLVSALFLLNYVYRAKWPSLILSGVFAGLAFLSKSPSLFLIPYTALVIGMDRLVTFGLGFKATVEKRDWTRRLWEFVRILLIWGGIAAIVFVVLWPVMWVEPLNALRWMRARATFHLETPHIVPVFFNGQLTYDDPGISLYLATIVWKTTLVTLPMVCVALIFALPWVRRGESSKLTWLLAVYVVCFTLQMGLGARKEPRYLLPAFPGLDLIAAFGLVQVTEAIGRIRWWQKLRWLPAVLLILVLALQADVTLDRHPYYGTHFNYLLGGPQVGQQVLALQKNGEGLDLAAQFLNTLPRAQQSRAMIHSLGGEIFERNFIGFTNGIDDPWINYRVYYLDQVVRYLGKNWGEAWNADRKNEPLWSVAFDGVTYVWVYGAPPGEPASGGPEYQVDYQLGG